MSGPNGERRRRLDKHATERLAETPALKFLSRVVLVPLMTVFVIVLGYFSSNALERIDQIAATLVEIRTGLAVAGQRVQHLEGTMGDQEARIRWLERDRQ